MLAKYADDSDIISPMYDTSDRSEALVKKFIEWSSKNDMSCNPSRCKEIVFKKKGISQTSALSILGVTFQEDCRCTTHVRNKLTKANKCLFTLRSLRKESYNDSDRIRLSVSKSSYP